ncbi:hypothetical protein WALSEDRAFT_65528 [Wallemia mellicola CBS 633.66]|uniref:Uncharacterized protein n=1 Tax=Wallemia mellicola (strain ATCC MYA-4683 / CBS 633.66) TaxID=671144 RepID=I4Y8V9_WALMC|nr:hypothetical protein WALSEDRAFT_65528 [Wallemia mellicola CBS 633.66]EIM20401.1 hypothetical protein WALSEDRAFT_65528 [Wallemia mellicola CBS 633.66]|eukprot:XP_006959657.1 hypothetical protein WALSEDRAFT_65528 [Wallemia mellicola CBS 633.66]
MLGTGKVESFDLAEALIPGSQEFLDGVSGKAVPDPEGSQVHKIKYELQSWNGPINWGDLNRLVSDLAVQMRVASDSLIDHSAATFRRYQTQITAGFFTIKNTMCQPRYYGLNLTSGEQGFEPYMAPDIVSEDYFSAFASGNNIRREESKWDSTSEVETMPPIQQKHEHYEYYLQVFITKCRQNGVSMRNFTFADHILQIFVKDDRDNWTDLTKIGLYDEEGNLLPEITSKYSY